MDARAIFRKGKVQRPENGKTGRGVGLGARPLLLDRLSIAIGQPVTWIRCG